MPRREIRAALPDEARWVGTRAMLSHGGCRVRVDESAPDLACVIVSDGRGALAGVVGRPRADIIRSGVPESAELLAFSENIDHVREALPGWSAERAQIHALPDWEHFERTPACPTRYLGAGEVRTLTHLDTEVREELQDAEGRGEGIVVAVDGSLPVSFCYASATTETLWDVAIDTIPSHRRRGFAEAAVCRMIRDQRARGLAPVWGAVESNAASLGMARKLRFVAVDVVWVLTP